MVQVLRPNDNQCNTSRSANMEDKPTLHTNDLLLEISSNFSSTAQLEDSRPAIILEENYLRQASRDSIVQFHVTSSDGETTETTTFKVSRKLICRRSPFFDAAFHGNFSEGISQCMSFDDISPEAFAIFVHWVKKSSVEIQWTLAVPNSKDLVHLWIMADRFLLPELQNRVIELLDRARMMEPNYMVPESEYHYVWENTSEESPLRLYILRTWPDVFMDPNNYPTELFCNLMWVQVGGPNPVPALDLNALRSFRVDEKVKGSLTGWRELRISWGEFVDECIRPRLRKDLALQSISSFTQALDQETNLENISNSITVGTRKRKQMDGEVVLPPVCVWDIPEQRMLRSCKRRRAELRRWAAEE